MKTPFKFLDSYTKADRNIFFGRDREIEELYQKVFESKILLLFGVSGTGKSSLIDCGLGNKINDSDWLPISVRRGGGMAESLVKQLSAFSLDSKIKNERQEQKGKSGISPGNIVKLIKSVYLDHFKPIYLIFDQFEELFIFGSREERVEFIGIVKAIMEAGLQCKMLFSIREEYLANITEFEREIPAIMENRMRVEKMSRVNAMQVISGPCRVIGIELEEGFEEALMAKLVPEGNEVELTYLQVYLDKVFRLASGQGKIARGNREESKQVSHINFSISHLEQLGNVSDLLGSFLEDQIGKLNDPSNGLAILKSFVSVKGTKRQVTLEEVGELCKSFGTNVAEDRLRELINLFVDLRILREKDENSRYELRHDSLAAKIFEKITLVEKEVMEVRVFIENAHTTFIGRKTLLSDEDLKYIEPYEDRLFLAKELQEFVDRSRNEIELRKRSFQKIMLVSIIGFVTMVVAFGYYYSTRSQDRRTNAMLMTTNLINDFSPVLGLRSSFVTYDRDTANSASIKAIYDSFYGLYAKFPDARDKLFSFNSKGEKIVEIKLSEDGSRIYGWLENGTALIWSESGEDIFSMAFYDQRIINMLLSRDNNYLGILFENHKIVIESLRDSLNFELETTLNRFNNKYLFDFSGRDDYLLAVARGDSVILYDKHGAVFQILKEHKGRVNALDISPDRRFIATASEDSSVIIWYFDSISNKMSIYNLIDGHSLAVRSCRFNSGSNYLLTASNDQRALIWNLYGDQVNSTFQNLTGLPWHILETLENYFEGVKCDAYFAANDKVIIVKVFREGSGMSNAVNKGIIYDRHSRASTFFDADLNRNIVPLWQERDSFDLWVYDHIVPAPDTKTVASVLENRNVINLTSWDHLQLLSLKGSHPLFSKDGRYLYSIDQDHIRKYVIDVEEIRRLCYDQGIFGELTDDFNLWVTY